jgi:hypothetical protein
MLRVFTLGWESVSDLGSLFSSVTEPMRFVVLVK